MAFDINIVPTKYSASVGVSMDAWRETWRTHDYQAVGISLLSDGYRMGDMFYENNFRHLVETTADDLMALYEEYGDYMNEDAYKQYSKYYEATRDSFKGRLMSQVGIDMVAKAVENVAYGSTRAGGWHVDERIRNRYEAPLMALRLSAAERDGYWVVPIAGPFKNVTCTDLDNLLADGRMVSFSEISQAYDQRRHVKLRPYQDVRYARMENISKGIEIPSGTRRDSMESLNKEFNRYGYGRLYEGGPGVKNDLSVLHQANYARFAEYIDTLESNFNEGVKKHGLDFAQGFTRLNRFNRKKPIKNLYTETFGDKGAAAALGMMRQGGRRENGLSNFDTTLDGIDAEAAAQGKPILWMTTLPHKRGVETEISPTMKNYVRSNALRTMPMGRWGEIYEGELRAEFGVNPFQYGNFAQTYSLPTTEKEWARVQKQQVLNEARETEERLRRSYDDESMAFAAW